MIINLCILLSIYVSHFVDIFYSCKMLFDC